jgi:hypothetical protein
MKPYRILKNILLSNPVACGRVSSGVMKAVRSFYSDRISPNLKM